MLQKFEAGALPCSRIEDPLDNRIKTIVAVQMSLGCGCAMELSGQIAYMSLGRNTITPTIAAPIAEMSTAAAARSLTWPAIG